MPITLAEGHAPMKILEERSAGFSPINNSPRS
jgi:hypothetical protein